MAAAKNLGPGHLNQFNKHRHLTNGVPRRLNEPSLKMHDRDGEFPYLGS
jgi:hypothetical protein